MSAQQLWPPQQPRALDSEHNKEKVANWHSNCQGCVECCQRWKTDAVAAKYGTMRKLPNPVFGLQYVSEAVSAIMEAPLKAADIPAAVQVPCRPFPPTTFHTLSVFSHQLQVLHKVHE